MLLFDPAVCLTLATLRELKVCVAVSVLTPQCKQIQKVYFHSLHSWFLTMPYLWYRPVAIWSSHLEISQVALDVYGKNCRMLMDHTFDSGPSTFDMYGSASWLAKLWLAVCVQSKRTCYVSWVSRQPNRRRKSDCCGSRLSSCTVGIARNWR